TRVVSIKYGTISSETARPGGLVAIGTTLDPSLTKADAMIGNVVGHYVPDPVNDLVIEYNLFERVVGTREQERVEPIRPRELLMLTIGTAVTLGVVTKVTRETVEVVLRRPVVALPNSKVAISRQVRGRWRLVGWGIAKI
ncbi:MAG TPA: translation initiation factor IF-2 subunit gamma, partial [Ignisphaera sp.]|nr:translation initiation factor IF-2 subunit gamma [Ignisphaera sp.]